MLMFICQDIGDWVQAGIHFKKQIPILGYKSFEYISCKAASFSV